MIKLTPILLIIGLSLSGCFSPSQDQVDKAVQKELQKREEERKRIYAYIDDYIKEKGGLPVAGGAAFGEGPKIPIEEQLRHPKRAELGESPVKGYRNAKVAIYEFSDFQCPYCQKVNQTLEDLLQKYAGKVKLIFKFFPQAIHPEGKLACQAAVAAQKQGKFWEMHDKMFANQTALKKEQLLAYAKELGMDPAKFEKDLEHAKTVQRVELETRQGAAIGVTTPPSFIINGVELINPQSEAEFTKIIDIILKK